MEASILTSVKKNLGMDATYTVFDHDLITFINTAFSTLHRLGIGSAGGFEISDDTAEWDDFLSDSTDQINTMKTYIFLRVRLLFDPPTSSYALASFEKQIQELTFYLNVEREGLDWVDPMAEEV